MKIFTLRHAQSTGNEQNIADSRLDSPLSDKGGKQAQDLVRALNKHSYDIFIVSPLKRTIETIQPFLATLDDPKVTVNELITERGLGEFTGTQIGAFKKYCENNNLDPILCKPKEGESILDVYERAKRFIEFLKNNFNKESILICSHKVFLSCLEIALTDKSIKNFNSYKSSENGEIREFNL